MPGKSPIRGPFPGGGESLALGESTVQSAAAADPRASGPLSAWGLTVAWHPDPARIGERAVLAVLAAGRTAALSRLEPIFSAPGGAARPLDDKRLSRRPWLLRAPVEGSLLVDRNGSPTALSADGEEIADVLELSRERLAEGTTLLLGHTVLLLLHRLDPQLDPGLPHWGLVGESAAMLEVRRAIARVCDLEVPVLVRGETGTGKELVARALHAAGARRDRPFVAVNMAALPPELAAAELFGAERGSFTGADRRRAGFFAEAQGGTLFLDEIGETPEAVQPLLLRALDSGEIQPLGAGGQRKVDLRWIAATDADLELAIAQRRFRAPLFHRLRGYEIRVPPLAARREDIGCLLVTFLRSELERIGEPERLAPGADWLTAPLAEKFVRAAWPGNVRELKAAVRQLAIASRGQGRAVVDAVLAAALAAPPPVAEDPGAAPQKTAAAPVAPPPAPEPGERKPADIGDEELVAAMRAARFRPQAAARILGIPRSSIYDLFSRSRRLRTADALGREEIVAAGAEHRGHVETMAAALEVSAGALRRRLRQLDLTRW